MADSKSREVEAIRMRAVSFSISSARCCLVSLRWAVASRSEM